MKTYANPRHRRSARIALVAFDLDGTLIGTEPRVHAVVRDAIRRMTAQGVHGCLATGRMYRAARPFIEELGLRAPAICYQGAAIVDPVSGKWLRERPLGADVTMRVARAALGDGMHVQLYSGDQSYVQTYGRAAKFYATISGVEPVLVPSLTQSFADRPSTKVVIVANAPEAAAYQERIRALCGRDAYVTRSYPEFIEILNPVVNKGEAFRFVAERLGVAREGTLAIGDSWNDIPLFRAAGLGVAMASAPPEVRAAAHAVVPSADEEGVAVALERFVCA